MKRRKFRSRPVGGKMSKRKIFYIVLVLLMLLTLQSFIFIEKNLRQPLMDIAQMRIKQIATQAINTAITERVAHNNEDVNRLIDWRMTPDGKVSGFVLNYAEHHKIAAETVDVVQRTLTQLQRVPERVPLGQALNSSILASFGPDVPVRFVPVGAVKVDLNTREQDLGINNVLVEIYIRIIAEVNIIIPFNTESEIVQTEVPLSYMLVVGDVPLYYFDNKGNPIQNHSSGVVPPTISLPDLKEQLSQDSSSQEGIPEALGR